MNKFQAYVWAAIATHNQRVPMAGTDAQAELDNAQALMKKLRGNLSGADVLRAKAIADAWKPETQIQNRQLRPRPTHQN